MSSRKDVQLQSKRTKPPTRLVVMNPSKGLNTLISPALIDDREFSDARNIQYDEGGVARVRDGTVRVSTALSSARGLGTYRTETYNQVMTVTGGLFATLTEGSNWLTNSSFTIDTATYGINFTQAAGYAFVWNGVVGGLKWDGVNLTSPGTLPKAKFSIYYQNKHIASGVDGQPNRLYIAAIADPSDFTVTTGGTPPQPDNATDVPGASTFLGTPGLTEANIIDVRKNDGDKVTALGIFQDQVIIFKERSIFSLTFDSTGLPTITPITSATGCVSFRSVRAVENDLYFLSREGLRSLGNQAQYFDAIRTSVLSTKIQPFLDDIDEELFNSCNAVYFQNKYLLGVPVASRSYSSSIVAYDRRFEAFSLWDAISSDAMTVYTDGENVEHLYFLTAAGSQLYELSSASFTDDSALIDAYLVSKAQDFGNIDVTKFFVDLGLVFRRVNGIVNITIYDDDGTELGSVSVNSASGSTTVGLGVNPLGLYVLGNGGQVTVGATTFADTPVRVVLNRQLRSLKFKVATSASGGRFTFAGMIYAVFPNSHYLFDSARKLYI